MDRREFLLATGSALATASLPPRACAAGRLPVVNTHIRRLTLSVADAGSASWTVVQAHLLARNIEAASATPLQISVVDQTASPAADLSLVTASELVARDPGFAFATGLPGNQTLTAEGLDAWLTGGGGQPFLDNLAACHGLKVLPAAHSGESFLWSKKPFEMAEDFAGKAIQAEGLACHVAAGLGAEPWRILEWDPAVSFARASLSAVEASITSVISNQLLQHALVAQSSALAPNGTSASLTVRMDTWNTFTHAERALLTAAARTTYLESAGLNRGFSILNRNSLAQSYGITISPVPVALASSIQTVSRAVIAQAASSSPSAAELNASYMSFMLNLLNSNAESSCV